MTGGSPVSAPFSDADLERLAAVVTKPLPPEWYRSQGICPSCKGMGGSYHTFGLLKTFARDCRECKGTGRV